MEKSCYNCMSIFNNLKIKSKNKQKNPQKTKSSFLSTSKQIKANKTPYWQVHMIQDSVNGSHQTGNSLLVLRSTDVLKVSQIVIWYEWFKKKKNYSSAQLIHLCAWDATTFSRLIFLSVLYMTLRLVFTSMLNGLHLFCSKTSTPALSEASTPALWAAHSRGPGSVHVSRARQLCFWWRCQVIGESLSAGALPRMKWPSFDRILHGRISLVYNTDYVTVKCWT